MKNKIVIIFSFFLISQIMIWTWVHYLNLSLAVDLENLTQERQATLSEQKVLRRETAQLTSLHRLEKEANKLGLVGLNRSISLDLPKTIALKP